MAYKGQFQTDEFQFLMTGFARVGAQTHASAVGVDESVDTYSFERDRRATCDATDWV